MVGYIILALAVRFGMTGADTGTDEGLVSPKLSMTVSQTMTPGGACKDVLDACSLLDLTWYCSGDYKSWAIQNCQKSCNLCGQTGLQATSKPHTIQTPVCLYKGKTYTQGQSWQVGCKYNCTCEDGSIGFYTCRDLCPTLTNLPHTCSLVTKLGECCAQLDCPNVVIDPFGPPTTRGPSYNVCYYKGVNYAQGETWDEGCTMTCTCYDASLGLYSCHAHCLNWSALPSICHLDDAPPGLCCKQPKCPPNINITIPKGYEKKYPGYETVLIG